MKKINNMELVNGGSLISKGDAACAIVSAISVLNWAATVIPGAFCSGWTVGRLLW